MTELKTFDEGSHVDILEKKKWIRRAGEVDNYDSDGFYYIIPIQENGFRSSSKLRRIHADDLRYTEPTVEELQKAICEYVNAQAHHMSDSWRDFFRRTANLKPDMGNPYHPLYPRKKT